MIMEVMAAVVAGTIIARGRAKVTETKEGTEVREAAMEIKAAVTANLTTETIAKVAVAAAAMEIVAEALVVATTRVHSILIIKALGRWSSKRIQFSSKA